jgi:hypothetical protein
MQLGVTPQPAAVMDDVADWLGDATHAANLARAATTNVGGGASITRWALRI